MSWQEVIIEVLEARRLIAADRGGTSDPFVILDIDGSEYKTIVSACLFSILSEPLFVLYIVEYKTKVFANI